MLGRILPRALNRTAATARRIPSVTSGGSGPGPSLFTQTTFNESIGMTQTTIFSTNASGIPPATQVTRI
ncbi:hypothetical protein APX70_200316 [Pseudomonas syringae pv. maculicola]|nr:hypothetical protein APX70_200316 [Pseudomonas syringae pv. maculicola]